MINPALNRQYWNSGRKVYAAADITLAIQAKHASATAKIVVTRLKILSITAHVNQVTIGDGTIVVAMTPATWTAFQQLELTFDKGIPLTVNTALSATSTAGAALEIWAEGYYEGIGE